MKHGLAESTPRDEEAGRNPSSREELEAIRDAMRPTVMETPDGAPLTADPRGSKKTQDSDWKMDEDSRQLGLQRLREMRKDISGIPGVEEARTQRAIDNIVIEDIPGRPRPEDLEDPS